MLIIISSLKITAVKLRDSGDYRCKVKNEYGVLEQRVGLTVTPSDESIDGGAIRREMGAIFRKQLKLYSVLSRCVSTIFDLFLKRENVQVHCKTSGYSSRCSQKGGKGMGLIFFG